MIALTTAFLSLVILGLILEGGGFTNHVHGTDLFGTFLPKFRESAELLRQGRVPLWNPFEYAGAPILGFSHGGVLYPPVFLAFFALEPIQALQWLFAIHVIGYVALILVCLTRSGLSLEAAAAAALLTISCSFLPLPVSNYPMLLEGAMYLPLLLVLWQSYTEGHRKALGWMALALGLQWLIGHPQTSTATSLLLGLVVLCDGRLPLGRRALSIAGAVGLGAMLGAVQLLPTLEAAAESMRADTLEQIAELRNQFSIAGPEGFARSLLSRYGAPALVLALVGLSRPGRLRLGFALALAWTTLPLNFPFSLLYEVPPFQAVRTMWEYLTLQPFFLGCFVAAGITQLRTPVGPRSRTVLLGASFAVAATCGILGEWFGAGLGALCGLAAVDPLRRRGFWALPGLLILLQVFPILNGIGSLGTHPAPDLAQQAERVTSLKALQDANPRGARVVSVREVAEGALLPGRMASPMGLESGLPPRRITHLLQPLGLDQVSIPWRLRPLARRWHDLAEHPGTAALLGIGFVVVPEAKSAPLRKAGYGQVARLGEDEVVLYREPVARFRMLDRIRASSDEQHSLRIVLGASFDPARAVVLEGQAALLPVDPAPAGAPGSVEILEDRPEQIRLRTHNAGRAILTTSEAYFPGWKARVDGEEVPILRANYAFRAVAVPAGTHEIEFSYQPRGFLLGGILSAVGFALTVLLLFVLPRGELETEAMAGPASGPGDPVADA